jgi:predicted glycosyltransferase
LEIINWQFQFNEIIQFIIKKIDLKMSLLNKKIWVDIEEPKTGIMFNRLLKEFQKEGAELLITARDYDSTFQILDNLHVKYQKVGRHGGEKLEDKLKTYIDRLSKLYPYVIKFAPDYFVTFSSVEGTRISYGLNIPSIGYNDEPRNVPVCKQIFPYLDHIITPMCVPEEWYIHLHANPEQLIRYNGIDEIAWLSEYEPNPTILEKNDLVKGKFVIIRSEPSFASYFIGKLKPEETLISQFFPIIFNQFPNHKYFLIVRTEKQELYLKKKLKKHINNSNVIITRFMPNMVDLCYFSALVISGGGTIVRESSLLNVPSIEFFPGDTAPQEHFLINNGFPLKHIKESEKIVEKSIEILSEKPHHDRFSDSFKKRIMEFENPNEICFKIVKENLLKEV